LSATGAAVIVLGPASLLADGNAGAGGDSPKRRGFGATGQAVGGSLNIGAFAHAQSGVAGTLTLSGVTGSASGLGNGTGNAAGQWHVERDRRRCQRDQRHPDRDRRRHRAGAGARLDDRRPGHGSSI
jgi:hypothetical protein